jgi:Leucine-rich repeat (LRR) protein
MSNNNLSSLNDAIFSHNTAIISVDISHNNIHYIHPETFRANKKLSILKMRKNRLFCLDEQIFFHNIKLKVIDFSNNEIAAISSLIFRTNTEIQSINLSTNSITQISPGTFDTNKNIIDVDLSHNKLKVLDNNIFLETQIKTLNLRGNRLTIKGDVPLLRAPFLENLDLGSCGITTLSPKTFQNIRHLKELLLDNNCLNLPIEPDPENNIFSQLHQLSKLDLSSNNITVMNTNLFYAMNNLKLLNLSFNPAVCDDCKREDNCIWFRSWCSSRSDQCGEGCNLEELSASQRNCINTTFMSEDMSHIKANTIFLNTLSRREEMKVHNKEKEVKSGKVIAMEQDNSLTLYLSLGISLPCVVIGVVVTIIIMRRKRRRSNGGYL